MTPVELIRQVHDYVFTAGPERFNARRLFTTDRTEPKKFTGQADVEQAQQDGRPWAACAIGMAQLALAPGNMLRLPGSDLIQAEQVLRSVHGGDASWAMWARPARWEDFAPGEGWTEYLDWLADTIKQLEQ